MQVMRMSKLKVCRKECRNCLVKLAKHGRWLSLGLIVMLKQEDVKGNVEHTEVFAIAKVIPGANG